MKKLNNLIVHCASSIVHQSKTLTLLVMLLSVNVWGEVAYTFTCPISSSNTGYTNTYNVTVDNITWVTPGNQSQSGGWRLGEKASGTKSRYLYSKQAIAKDITEIVVAHGSFSNMNSGSTVKLDVYSTAALAAAGGNGDVSSLTAQTLTANINNTFQRPSGVSWANRFYRFTYSLNLNGSKNSAAYITLTSIIFNYSAKSDVTLTPTQSSRNVDKDDMIEDEDLGSWFTIDPSAYDGTISYTSSNPSVFDVEDGVGFAYSAGTCSLYISASETTKYKAANCTISVTVNETCGNPITISKSPATLPSGCSFSLDKTSGCGDDSGESVLVTCSPATHYTVTAVNSTSGTPGAISNNKCTVSGIKANTTISVTFTEDTKYTVTFVDKLQHTAFIPGTTNNEIVVYENETFTFPTIGDKTAATSGTCEQIHYHFMGWSTSEGSVSVGDIKTGTSAAVTATATYYAVWAKEEL